MIYESSDAEKLWVVRIGSKERRNESRLFPP